MGFAAAIHRNCYEGFAAASPLPLFHFSTIPKPPPPTSPSPHSRSPDFPKLTAPAAAYSPHNSYSPYGFLLSPFPTRPGSSVTDWTIDRRARGVLLTRGRELDARICQAAFHRQPSFFAKSWRFTPFDIATPPSRINRLASSTDQPSALSSQPVGTQSATRQ